MRVAAIVIAACTEPNSAATCVDGTCTDPAYPYCDADGIIAGTPGRCIAVSCNPDDIAACSNGDALTCNTSGDGYERVVCDLDCFSSPTPHCAYIEPRYLPDVCEKRPSADSLAFSNSGTFDPNLDTNCSGGVVSQAGGPEICVVRAGAISIEPDAVIVVLGRTPGFGRVVALVADTLLRIDGVLDVGAKGKVNGPGGGVIHSGGVRMAAGAGGAGGRTAGGAGGTETLDGGTANGGNATGNPALLAGIIGGAAAYKYDVSADPNDALGGGGGGGAALLVACRGSVSIAGTINAGGGGGRGGIPIGTTPGLSGLGGGAGGYVVVQARTIEITGRLFANGGAGGSGKRADGFAGSDGQDGSLSATDPATTLSLVQASEGRGGIGGVGTSMPGAGGAPQSSNAKPGAGGGSTGFLQTYTPRGTVPHLQPSEISPPFEPNATIPLR